MTIEEEKKYFSKVEKVKFQIDKILKENNTHLELGMCRGTLELVIYVVDNIFPTKYSCDINQDNNPTIDSFTINNIIKYRKKIGD